MDIPDLPNDHPRANLLIFSQLIYKTDKQFQKKCHELSHQSLHEVQQQQNTDLIDMLDQIPHAFHHLHFHQWVNLLN